MNNYESYMLYLYMLGINPTRKKLWDDLTEEESLAVAEKLMNAFDLELDNVQAEDMQ